MNRNYMIALLLSIALLLTACNPAQRPTDTTDTSATTGSETIPATEERTQLRFYIRGSETVADAYRFSGDGYSISILENGWNYQRDSVGGFMADLWCSTAEENAALMVVKLAASGLAEAQSWLKETFVEYDLLEDSQGGMGGTDVSGRMMDVQIWTENSASYLLIKMYALDSAETAGVYLTVMADTFQISGSAGIAETALAHNSAPSAPSRHIAQTVSKDLIIDAEVSGEPLDGLAGVYIAKPKDFSKEEINAFITCCGESIVSTKEWDDGAMAYYNGECTNGYRFGYMWGLDGRNNHPYAQFQFYDTGRYMTYYDYPIYTGEENYITNPRYTVGWMFTEPKTFSFATAEDAEISVRNALAILGLPDLTLLRTLYIDHDTLAKAGELLASDENYAPIIGDAENNGYTLRDDWSEEEDAYLFSFGISVNGTPMSYFFDDSDKTATYCGSEINVWYTKSGITFLRVSTPWTVAAAESSPEPIISAEAALEVAKEKYSYDLSMKDKRIEEIRLLYKYSQNRNQWLLRPAWTVQLSYQIGQSTDRYYQFMYIDALTGKER